MKAFTLATMLLLGAVAAPAAAATLQFTLSGNDFGGAVEFAKFRIDAQPTILPNNYSSGDGFRVKFLSGIFQYDTTIATVQDIQFFSNANGGGFINLDPADKLGDSTFLSVISPQLYTGPEAAPSLVTGNFTVSDGYSGAPLSLTIAQVPEPETWALMIAGFSAVGFHARRRAKATLSFA